ncbi:hypothetical protein HWB91_gp73 [Bacillus phage vB_BboS-125]|uniref:Uncharacterized protein n=1 Tax=Bacillus phage vB_BboS-125 TaxID=2419618 RepID=A0A3G3BW02_9CAUD|nr:hypothetical protein HWB91_gp73 [Bacillus phage vB_BboS-125]AYP68443.1 hypothetical protein BboS125_00074 [Bacillus phage vB_BboS-125]
MYLKQEELKATYYKKAEAMDAADVSTYLARANSYAQGIIGGPLPEKHVDDGLKAAVAMAFEILAKDETGAQIDEANGNITQAAPEGYFTRRVYKGDNPFKTVDTMLLPYAALYDQLQKPNNDNGVRFF